MMVYHFRYGASMSIKVYPWFIMASVLSRLFIAYHSFIMIYDELYYLMFYHGQSWFTMMHRGLSWFTIVYHGLS